MSKKVIPVPSRVVKYGHTYDIVRNKVVRDGTDVAVLVSPGFGAGWSTWNDDHLIDCLFDPEIVFHVLNKTLTSLDGEAVAERLGDGRHFCVLGMKALVVSWLPKGTLFRVSEYDGSESLETMEQSTWIKA